MSWTDERVELLTKLWGDGLSASQIAAELGNVTRNAVIGKVHRLGLSGRAKATRSAPVRSRRPRAAPRAGGYRTMGNTALKAETALAPAARPAPAPAPVAELVVPPEEGKSILELNEHTCKWPIGDPGRDDFYFCGRSSETGLPYCAHHARVAYQPLQDRRRERRAARSG